MMRKKRQFYAPIHKHKTRSASVGDREKVESRLSCRLGGGLAGGHRGHRCGALAECWRCPRDVVFSRPRIARVRGRRPTLTSSAPRRRPRRRRRRGMLFLARARGRRSCVGHAPFRCRPRQPASSIRCRLRARSDEEAACPRRLRRRRRQRRRR